MPKNAIVDNGSVILKTGPLHGSETVSLPIRKTEPDYCQYWESMKWNVKQ